MSGSRSRSSALAPSGPYRTIGAMSLIPGEPPLVRAPSFERRALVPWLTRADITFLKDYRLSPSMGLAAADLADSVLRPRLAGQIRNSLGLGLALDPQLSLLQLTDEHLAQHFAAEIALLSEPLGEPFDPMSEPMDDSEAERLAIHLIDLSVRGLGTALLAGSFLMLEPSQVGLDNNLALLANSARYFHEEGIEHQADDSVRFPAPRQLFATISIERRVLAHDEFLNELLDAYVAAAPGLYGYWVQVANIGSTPRPADVRRLSDFIYELQSRTGKPVIPDRLGQLGLGFLAGGVAGYCIGTGAPEFLRFPRTTFIRADGQKPKGFTLVAYHPDYLRNFQTIGRHSARAKLAFQRRPCRCGFHPRREPPTSTKAKKLHCFDCRALQVLELAEHPGGQAARTFLQMVAAGEKLSTELDGDLQLYAALRETLPREAAEDALADES